MQFPGKITRHDLTEARDLVRPKQYWPGVSVWLGMLLGSLLAASATLAFDFVRRLARGTHTKWWGLGLALLGLAVAIYLLVLAANKAAKRRFAQILAELPGRIDLVEAGVGFDGPGVAGHVRPWQDFKSWIEGKRVILLEWSEGGVPVILPLVGLSDAERRELRQFLRAHIPVPTAHSQRPAVGIGLDRVE